MKKKQRFFDWVAWLLVLFLVAPPGLLAQGAEGSGPFKPEELDALLAPIALYPDELLSQILMASTYPLEVVQADRWVRANKDLKGDQLAVALEKQSWDPSVKSLVNFPQVLVMMSEKLDWTEKLGDAFLASEKDVMDTVQKLRLKAQEAGNLKTTEQQKVIVQEKVIVIEPAQPEVIYVPTYNPVVVYGPWWYPAYPPYYYYPPGYVAGAALFSFGVGFAVGAAWGYAWGHCNWHGGNVNINVNRNININNNINRNVYANRFPAGSGGQGNWQHDPSHRKGVAYRDQTTAQKFNRGTSSEAARSREAYRGHTDQSRQGLSQGTGDRGSRPGTAQTRDRQASGAGQQGFQQRKDTGGTGQQALQQKQMTGGAGGEAGQRRGDNAFSGIGSGKETQNYSNRGSASRSGGYSGGGSLGGGSRSGGARR